MFKISATHRRNTQSLLSTKVELHRNIVVRYIECPTRQLGSALHYELYHLLLHKSILDDHFLHVLGGGCCRISKTLQKLVSPGCLWTLKTKAVHQCAYLSHLAKVRIMGSADCVCPRASTLSSQLSHKANSPCLKTGITHKSRHSKRMNNTSLVHSFIHSFRNIHIHDRDLPWSFQVPRLIENTTHTPVLQSHAQVHTPTVFLIQQSWVISLSHCYMIFKVYMHMHK